MGMTMIGIGSRLRHLRRTGAIRMIRIIGIRRRLRDRSRREMWVMAHVCGADGISLRGMTTKEITE
jgi:hypothetical protein